MKNKKIKVLLSTTICMVTMTSTVFASPQSLEVKKENEIVTEAEVKSSNGWKKENNKWYYYKDNTIQTGWIYDGYNWYYSNPNGVMQTGWLSLGGSWYYLNSSGAMQTGWLQLGDNWYYLNSSGVMQTNTVIDGWAIDSNGIATKTEKVYTGASVKNALIGQGCDNIGDVFGYLDREYGYGRIAAFQVGGNGSYDMMLELFDNPAELNGKVRSLCNTILPGLYEPMNSGENQTLNIGGRTVEIEVRSYATVATISPING